MKWKSIYAGVDRWSHFRPTRRKVLPRAGGWTFLLLAIFMTVVGALTGVIVEIWAISKSLTVIESPGFGFLLPGLILGALTGLGMTLEFVINRRRLMGPPAEEETSEDGAEGAEEGGDLVG
jgi:hypothetical protein